MNYVLVGELILKIRKEKNLTQLQLAEKLNVSDKTISKWERGLGCPDVSILRDLSDLLEVNIDNILSGNLVKNRALGGNMNRIQFYSCPHCGNVITTLGESEISCCGRKLMPLEFKNIDAKHNVQIDDCDDEYYITFNHEMTKEHYITFIAYVSYDKVTIVKLYPEQNSELHFPKLYGGKFFVCCNKDGLYKLF